MSNARILVVDDDRAYADLVTELLALGGYAADATRDVEAASARLQQDHYGAVVTDLHMQPRGGLDLLAIVRELHPETPVIVMSSFPTRETRRHVLESGATAFIDKPFQANDLIGLVSQVARRRHALDPRRSTG